MVQNRRQGSRLFSRRQFLLSASASGALLLTGRRSAAQSHQVTGYDQIAVGLIGAGRRGRALLRPLRQYVRAICDVDRDHLREGLEIAAPGTEALTDYRDLLDRPDITAVIIATPNHWHGKMAIDACLAGKDVYVEPPAAFYLGESAQLVAAAEQSDVIVAVGAAAFKAADPIPAEEGAIYPCSAAANPAGGRVDAVGNAPAPLDWPAWLGPAPWHPYSPDYCHDTWRWMLEFGGGRLVTEGPDQFQRVLAQITPKSRVIRISATGSGPVADLWTCPSNMDIRYQFEGGQTIHWTQEGSSPSASPVLDADDAGPAMTAWIESLRSRRPPTISLEAACRAAELAVIGNLAYQMGRPLAWDAQARHFVDDPQANRLIAAPVTGVA